jgi:hypothetical protein
MIQVYVAGELRDFPEANSYSLGGKLGEGSLALWDVDEEAHQVKRLVALFPAGAWQGTTGGLDLRKDLPALGFEIPPAIRR